MKRRCLAAALFISNSILEQFQEKCVAVFRPELCKNKELEHFHASMKNGDALAPIPEEVLENG
jgi:hypothetical protein